MLRVAIVQGKTGQYSVNLTITTNNRYNNYVASSHHFGNAMLGQIHWWGKHETSRKTLSLSLRKIKRFTTTSLEIKYHGFFLWLENISTKRQTYTIKPIGHYLSRRHLDDHSCISISINYNSAFSCRGFFKFL